MEPRTTNEDLIDRIYIVENKVDAIYSKLDQISGAWAFVKILSSVVAGLVVTCSIIYGWFK